MPKWWPFKRRSEGVSVSHHDLVKIAEGSANPLETLRSLHLKALTSDDSDLLLATTTGLGVIQGMTQAMERSGSEKRQMIEAFAAVVYAAGGEVIVSQSHMIQVPYLVLISEKQMDGSFRWQSGVRQ
jgi:hypothetical protein